jgi:hypothetical protein
MIWEYEYFNKNIFFHIFSYCSYFFVFFRIFFIFFIKNIGMYGYFVESTTPRTDATCLKNSYIHHELTEILTGHCRLNHHLHKIKKISSSICECGQDTETVEHFLFHCIRFTDQRALLIDACLRNKKPFPPSLDVISKRKSIWNAFKVFIRTSERLKIRSTAHGQCTPPLPRSKANVQSKPTGQFL